MNGYSNTVVYELQKSDAFGLSENFGKKSILVVEDDYPMRFLLSAIFEEKYEVDAVSNGQEAFSKIKKKSFDLIISDCDMPVMDGIELFERTSRIIKGLHNKFIFSTGCLSSDKKRYFRENRVKYLLKPYSIDEIMELTEKLLYKHQSFGYE